MVNRNKVPRAQETDENRNVVQGGTALEIQVLACTASNMGAMNFSEIPKAVKFQTRTGATDVEFVYGTATVAQTNSGGFYTMRAGQELAIDCASTGSFYFRNSAANQSTVVIGLALL